MEAIREIYDNAPAEVWLTIPPTLQHRRVEIIVLPLDGAQPALKSATDKRYKTLPVIKRVIVSHEALHER